MCGRLRYDQNEEIWFRIELKLFQDECNGSGASTSSHGYFTVGGGSHNMNIVSVFLNRS